jgi:hypothetical protein
MRLLVGADLAVTALQSVDEVLLGGTELAGHFGLFARLWLGTFGW